MVSELEGIGLPTVRPCHSLSSVAIVRSVLGRLWDEVIRPLGEKKGEIALFDSSQLFILTIKRLSAEKPYSASEGHSYGDMQTCEELTKMSAISIR